MAASKSTRRAKAGGAGSLAMALGAAAAQELHAPQLVWVGVAVVAATLLVYAAYQFCGSDSEPETREPSRSAKGGTPIDGLDPTEVALALREAVDALEVTLTERSSNAPRKPEGSSERNYFGPPDYAGETVAIYTREHRENFLHLLRRAEELGYALEGRQDLAKATTVDALWTLRARAVTTIRTLEGTCEPPPHTVSERVAYAITVGRDVCRKTQTDDGRSYEPGYGTTPYQAFIGWWHDVQYLLRFNFHDEWERLWTAYVLPTSISDSSDIAAFIELVLDRLQALSVAPEEV